MFIKKFAVLIVLAVGSALLVESALLAQTGATAGASDQSQAVPTIRSTTRLVQVSVVVTDKKGEPIAGLKKEDFAVLDENKEQPIAFFSEATPNPPAAHASLLPKNVFTNRYDLKGQDPGAVTVVLFDSLNTASADQSRVRQQVVKFLGALKPQDRVAVYALTTQLLLLHDFTQDSAALVDAASHFQPEGKTALDASNPELFEGPGFGGPHSGWAQFAATVNATNDLTADKYKADRAETTAAAFTDIANHVATIPGRKNLVWVSGSFPLIVNPGTFQASSGIDLHRDIRDLSGYADRATKALNRVDMAVYAVDAAGVVTGSGDPQQRTSSAQPSAGMFDQQNQRDAERLLASATGGEAFYGNNDITNAMNRAFEDGRYAYTIGFYPDHGKWNGEFRKIKVESKTPGIKLRYREGYFAVAEGNGSDQQRAKAALQEAAMSPLDATALGMIVSGKWSGPSADRKVEFHVGVDPKQLLLEQTADHRKGEVDLFFVQRNAKGIVAAEDQRVALDLEEKHYDYLTQAGLVFARHLTISPEASEVRILARDAGSEAIGSVTIPIKALFEALGPDPTVKLQDLK